MNYEAGTGSRGGSEGRELAFKLLVARAIADAEFFDDLMADPQAAARRLHIHLDDDDLAFLATLDWNGLAAALPRIRSALNLGVIEASW